MPSSTPVMPSLQLVERRADGSVRFIAVANGLAVSAAAGTQYALIDKSTGKSPEGLRLLRKGDALVIEQDDNGELVQIDNFFQQDDVAFVPDASLDSSTLSGDSIASAQVIDTTSSVEPASGQNSGDDTDSGLSASTWGWIGAGVVGVGLIAASGGGGGGSDSAPPPPPAVVNTVSGTVVAGPVIAGNDLRVDIYAADGTTKLGEGTVNADGNFSVAVGDYVGVVIVRVVNTGTSADYRDEATGANKDLNAQLFAAGVVTESNATVPMNVNVLTTIAYQKALEAAGSGAPTAEMVNGANAAIARVFDVDSLHRTSVVPTNGGSYDNADGLSNGERYGAVLAALSGADAENGGNSQQTIDNLVAGIAITGGVATLDSNAQNIVVQGANRTTAETGVDLTQVVVVVVDKQAPGFTSGAAAAAINENSGAGQVVYTAAATDAGTVSYSLKSGGDAALFTINSATGAVTLVGNPDFEAQSSYNFTVIATDPASNSSEQAVALTINNLDEVAPTITSGATATAITENSGAGQLVYTVTSTDSGDIVSGATTYSLKSGGDAALFTINAATGAVTLTGNPDYEAKSNYNFTVVATDAANNSSEQAVTLAVNNLDEVAPTITSGAVATAINENSGASQVVYTITSTDNGDIANGTTTYSLKSGGDAALFTINATTGAVTLTANPNFETKSSYSFTVVATDAANHASEQVVTLAINNLDEVAPTITSGAVATAINENSGASQVIYTVTSTDSGDISSGVTYSLKTGADAALFTINATTGAVTLTGNPDYEAKSSYSFTVVATDAANHASEQAVSLAINDLDEIPPTLSSSTPADNGSFAPNANIVLTFSENVQAGSGNIVISNGTDTRTIAVTDNSQVSISGTTVTINPTADLDQSSAYHVLIDNGALTDAAGNAYSGISNTTTLNFQTLAADIVVFDLLEGVSSSHSNRTFDANTTYTIYIRVDSDSQAMSTSETSSNPSATWGVWSGGNNLGSDDRIVVVGDGSPILGIAGQQIARVGFFSYTANSSANPSGSYIAFGRAGNDVLTRSAAHFHPWGSFARGAIDVNHFPHQDIWTGTWASAPIAGGLSVANNVLTDMPAGILTSQGLA